ncbi:MAG: hypothetical protein U0P81_02555 [Holophagaceae bacterium]
MLWATRPCTGPTRAATASRASAKWRIDACRPPLRPWAGPSKATTRKPASTSRAMKPRIWPARPPQPCTSSTVGASPCFGPQAQAARPRLRKGTRKARPEARASRSAGGSGWRGGRRKRAWETREARAGETIRSPWKPWRSRWKVQGMVRVIGTSA